MTAKQLANLKQYKDKPQEEIDNLIKGAQKDYQNDSRISEYLSTMQEQYDLSEMNHNDRSALEDLARISIDIEDQEERYREKLEQENVDWYEIEKIINILQKLRADRSKIEYDLNITRRSRQSTEEASVTEALESWKLRAKKMLSERLNYVYCPKCKLLNANVWFLNPIAGNSLTITCARESCGHKFTVTGSELIEYKNKNLVLSDKGKLTDLMLET